MEKMSYKISSRTTILIGREGVSRADGAIIELIKNTYDADAKFCYIAFDVEEDTIYLLDNGTGMTRDIIETAWMLIGTDNKKQNYLSETQRVRSGEKGIGRFALDRLGSTCTMYTKHKSEKLIYWYSNWDKFEEPGKTLDEINADFDYLESSFIEVVPSFIKDNIISAFKNKNNDKVDLNSIFNTGTLLVIKGLRDKWTDNSIKKIFSVLGFLIPPGEQTQYYIFAQMSKKHKVEMIESETIDDFDYKVKASFDGKSVSATIFRNEFDFNIMPKDLFLTDAFKDWPYNLETFEKGEFSLKRTLSELLGTSNEEFLHKAKELGEFDFQYVFMKLSGGEGNFYYKTVNPKRSLWMKEHGGIKIYRDNFVVRPYGDPESKTFDWLGLDARKNVNPGAISDDKRQWHVGSSQIQGTVLISRMKNASILDKSNREGIIENDYFEVLSNILLGIISLFEKDRAYIAYNIKKFKEKKDNNDITKAQASKIANELLTRKKKKQSKKGFNFNNNDTEKLAKAVKIYEEEREELISEIKLLRALATNGLMTTSMVHDLKTINSLLTSRSEGFKIAINLNDHALIERHLNDLKSNDDFLHSWISVITVQSNRDRRKRLKKNMFTTITSAVELLTPILQRKKINLKFVKKDGVAAKKIFETDFDSIIYNLIINSIESFEESKCINREITIDLEADENFYIRYMDNGHGLSEAFLKNPYDIFLYGTTSKFDSNGNQIGTGLGMYIVASSINEYSGKYTITKVKDGFGLEISIPLN
jgi:signal transduction histidine kinase